MSSYEEFFELLNSNDVRYIVVGGLAVVLHGHPRMTADIDLVVDLNPSNALLAIRTLTSMGLRPRLPVDPEAFADVDQRSEWIEKRGMVVFNLTDPANPLRSVDLFVESPIPFDELWSRSVMIKLSSGSIRVASIEDLIAMKKTTGRSIDKADIEALEALRDETED